MRSHFCGEVNENLDGQQVTLCGWVQRRRDHGGVIFLDLRDYRGLVQVVYQPEDAEVFTHAEKLRHEFVIQLTGTVRARPEGMVNEELASGKIEVVGESLTILNAAEPLPFQLDEHDRTSEDIRLGYRYLDLRRPEMQERLRMRGHIVRVLRNFLESHDFLDVETPMLTKATPEGARDYLVPSRTHQGAYFALPQSPQIFKQLLMMSGVDRYYQVVRCFRDEDLRADRQPEFTQLDIELSFTDEHAIQALMEQMICQVFKAVSNVELPQPFPRMTYEEAMRRYGSDKPDLRIAMELVDVGDLMTEVEFKVFSGPAQDADGRVAALCLPKGAELSRKDFDDYTKFVSIYGAKGLAYIKVNDRNGGRDGLQSPILKFLPDEVLENILQRTGANTGDAIFFGADKKSVVDEALGALRVKLGHDHKLIEGDWAPLWVVDFPMFAKGENGRWDPLHHPFTAPAVDDVDTLMKDPGAALSRAYDIVLNGTELGGGSIRIHRPDMQEAVFRCLGIDDDTAQEKFGHLLTALKYGCPPLGGIALGLDRWVMLMAGAHSIRDVIAFPKTQSAACPLTQAPSAVSVQQLQELGIRPVKQQAS